MIALALPWACGIPSGGDDSEAETCCLCLVDVGCVRANEYDFCKDTLESGSSLEVSGLRSLTCDETACMEANRCASVDPSVGSNSGTPPAEPPAAPNPNNDDDRTEPGNGGSGRYLLTVHGAEFSATDLNGANWDVFRGDVPPDAYVSVRIDGESIGVTSTAPDTYSPTWEDEFPFTFEPSTTLSFRFFDYDDVSGNDYGGEFFVSNLSAAVRDGGRSESISGIAVSEISYSIRPR